MRRVVFVLALVLAARMARATPVDLDAFLRSVEQASQPPTAVRADGELTVTTPDKTTTSQLVLIQRDANDLFLELRQPPLKALITGAGASAYVLVGTAKDPKDWPQKDALADSDFNREDLEPFVLDHYQTPRIVDESPDQVTVALFPKHSQYSLLVFTFDREKKVPLKTMYYEETFSNLVKMRRDSDHVLIGRRWLPTKITMEQFALRTQSALQLSWTQDPPITPELFQPAFLARAPAITWPTPAH